MYLTPFTHSHTQLDYSRAFLFMPGAGVWTANLDRRIETPRALGHYFLHISPIRNIFSVAVTIIVSCGPNCVGIVD